MPYFWGGQGGQCPPHPAIHLSKYHIIFVCDLVFYRQSPTDFSRPRVDMSTLSTPPQLAGKRTSAYPPLPAHPRPQVAVSTGGRSASAGPPKDGRGVTFLVNTANPDLKIREGKKRQKGGPSAGATGPVSLLPWLPSHSASAKCGTAEPTSLRYSPGSRRRRAGNSLGNDRAAALRRPAAQP